MDILEMIDKHNLSIRKIPLQTVELYELQHYKEGDEIVTLTKEEQEKRWRKESAERFIKRFPEGRKFCRRIKIPDHAGWYMCKQVNSTDTTVRWNIKTDYLAPTLEESINLFLKDE